MSGLSEPLLEAEAAAAAAEAMRTAAFLADLGTEIVDGEVDIGYVSEASSAGTKRDHKVAALEARGQRQRDQAKAANLESGKGAGKIRPSTPAIKGKVGSPEAIPGAAAAAKAFAKAAAKEAGKRDKKK